MHGKPFLGEEVFLHEHREQRREQPRVGAGLHLQMDVGHLSRFRAAWVHNDETAGGVLRDGFQCDARPRNAV
jgi:hypothetical protein